MKLLKSIFSLLTLALLMVNCNEPDEEIGIQTKQKY